MCLEIATMEESYQKDTTTTPVHKKNWSKGKKRRFLPANIGERKRRARAWSARRPPTSPDRVDSPHAGNHSGVPSVAMAPRNTTQYLMDLVYSERLDVPTEPSLRSPVSFDRSEVVSSSDSDYDRSLDFQQREFENVFFRNEM